MAKYLVKIPVSGTVTLVVESNNAEAATDIGTKRVANLKFMRSDEGGYITHIAVTTTLTSAAVLMPNSVQE
jgi:hypothetical protein